MEVPAQRQIPKGALVLIMDPAEAPDGNYWGEQCASRQWKRCHRKMKWASSRLRIPPGRVADGPAPLAVKGDGSRGDGGDQELGTGRHAQLRGFHHAGAGTGRTPNPGLLASDARANISSSSPTTIRRCRAPPRSSVLVDNKISVSTITVYPHQPGNVAPGIRELAKTTGGKSYGPFEGNLAPLPQIFIKEATVVKRSIVQEDPEGFSVTLAATSSDLVKGIAPGPMPKLYGYDLTGRKR